MLPSSCSSCRRSVCPRSRRRESIHAFLFRIASDACSSLQIRTTVHTTRWTIWCVLWSQNLVAAPCCPGQRRLSGLPPTSKIKNPSPCWVYGASTSSQLNPRFVTRCSPFWPTSWAYGVVANGRTVEVSLCRLWMPQRQTAFPSANANCVRYCVYVLDTTRSGISPLPQQHSRLSNNDLPGCIVRQDFHCAVLSDAVGQPGVEQCLSFHPNGLAVVQLAPTHPAVGSGDRQGEQCFPPSDVSGYRTCDVV